jgi:hypothetical protein
MYGTKGVSAGKRRVTLPVEFHRLIRQASKVLIVEDLISSGTMVRLLTQLVEGLGGQVIGIGALWRRTKKTEIDGKEIFSLVSRDFPTHPPRKEQDDQRHSENQCRDHRQHMLGVILKNEGWQRTGRGKLCQPAQAQRFAVNPCRIAKPVDRDA